jgi:hypothetical protein
MPEPGVDFMFLDQIRHIVRNRSRKISLSLAFGGAAVMLVAASGGAAAANAAPGSTTSITFFSGSATFRVGGHTWSVSVANIGGAVHFTDIGIATGHETDDWTFNLTRSILTVNQRTGDATLNSRSSFAPVAFAKLKFTTNKRQKASCTKGSETIFSGSVSGSLTLIANHKGLKFQSAHVRFTGGLVSIDHGCITRIPPSPCAPGVWNNGSPTVNASGTAQALPGERTTFVASIFETINLKAPTGATVNIGVAASENKPVFNSTKKTLQVSARGVISGAALITASGPPAVNSFPCVLGGKHFKARDVTYTAKFASPKGSQFQARSIVVGLLRAPRSGFSLFDIITLKRA